MTRCLGPTLSKKQLKQIRKELEFFPDLDELAVWMALAGNPTRLRILYLLDMLHELCVCDLAEMLGISVSGVSQQLAKLKAYGLLVARREGQTIFYRLAEHPFIRRLLEHFLNRLEKAPVLLQGDLPSASADVDLRSA